MKVKTKHEKFYSFLIFYGIHCKPNIIYWLLHFLCFLSLHAKENTKMPKRRKEKKKEETAFFQNGFSYFMWFWWEIDIFIQLLIFWKHFISSFLFLFNSNFPRGYSSQILENIRLLVLFFLFNEKDLLFTFPFPF